MHCPEKGEYHLWRFEGEAMPWGLFILFGLYTHYLEPMTFASVKEQCKSTTWLDLEFSSDVGQAFSDVV